LRDAAAAQLRNAQPRPGNRFKVTLAERAIVRAVNIAAGREAVGVTGAPA
jgi:xanthine dehydrogenase YagS FAD-binding subunit